MFGNVRVGTISDLRPNLEVYRAAWREAGHPGEGRVYLRNGPMRVASRVIWTT